MLHDVRLALRGLKSQPSFAIVAIVTLALGIGATTAVFTIVNGILLRSLPYHDPDRLVLLRADVQGADRLAALTAAEFEELRSLTGIFEGLGVVTGNDASLT